ncbi:MAG: GHMP kinase [Verrucomicrobia bacterium]|nr:GHMP kinase [Verrucomicrobiota bacterium]
MIMGEHAVLNGKQAIVAAVDKRITVRKKLRSDDCVIIRSALGDYSSRIGALEPDPRFSFVLACLEGMTQGVELDITSQFSHEVGLGSSAAVCVATNACLYGLKEHELFRKSLEIIRKVQTVGSGADVAASVFGGILLYGKNIERIGTELPLTLVYSGSKMKTKDVIEHVKKLQNRHPAQYDAIFNGMNALVEEAKEAIKAQDLVRLGELFTIHHGYQEAIGTCNGPLAEIVHAMRRDPNIYGAKISGSGLGDSVIGLGSISVGNCNLNNQIPVTISLEGVL